MKLKKRQVRILDALSASGVASVHELAQALEVSESTIRRDLEILDRNGELTRTYGGAVLRPGSVVDSRGREGRPERSYAEGEDVDALNKQAMAAAACEMITDGMVIVLDIGTTTPLIARELKGRDVTVITSNLAVFDELRDDDVVRLVLLGGVVRRNYRTLVGSLTEATLAQVSADIVFLSCTGVRPSGHVVDNMAVEAPIKHSMINASDRVVLLASETKFPGTGALRLCSLTDVDVLITTTNAPDETLTLCRNAGGEVRIVEGT